MTNFYSKKAARVRRKKGNGSAFGLSFEALEDRRMLAAVTVTTAVDLVDGDTSSITRLFANPGADDAISLREALAASDNTSETDTITFDPSVFNGEEADVIRLQDQLSVSNSVNIDGGDLGIVVSGDTLGNDETEAGTFITILNPSNSGVLENTERVFSFSGRFQSSTISGLTITGARGSQAGGGILVVSSHNLTLSQSTVSGNSAWNSGGGIQFGTGVLTIDQSTISGNVAQQTSANFASGGGIATEDGDIVITDSTINDNRATGNFARGGGVYSESGNLSLSTTTISGNSANSDFDLSEGGGVFVGTRSANLSTQALSIDDSTITFNRGDFGGGITVESQSTNFNLANSIVARNFSTENTVRTTPDVDISIGVASLSDSRLVTVNASFSLIGDNSGTSLSPTSGEPDLQGNLIGTAGARIDPLLFGLTDNGGPTETHALRFDSPAIDAGSSSLDFDQRGEPRVVKGQADIGAFELEETFIVVDTSEGFSDFNVSSGNLSLPEAIAIANSTPEVETIVFDPNVFNGEAGDVIHLQQELFIDQAVTIDAGDLNVVISGDRDSNDFLLPGTFITDIQNNFNDFDNVRPFEINIFAADTVATVTLRGLTITGGANNFSGTGGGGIESAFASLVIDNSIVAGNIANNGGGGGILVRDGSLTVRDSEVSDNRTGSNFSSFGSFGGGVQAVNSDVTLTGSSVSRNFSVDGGGISLNNGDVNIIDTEISDNIADVFGGGISIFQGDVIVDQSTISGNAARNDTGGGIYAGQGSVTVSNSTLSGNLADRGGAAIAVRDGNFTITDSTIVENQSIFDGAITFERITNFNTIVQTVTNSIIANDQSQSEFDIEQFQGGVTLNVSSSLIGNNSFTTLTPAPVGSPDADGNIIGEPSNRIDPLVGELADNGGPTRTHALLPTSPAIDTGSTSSTTDQRGLPRPNIGGNGPDIGAFEAQSLTLIVDTNSDVSDGDFSPGNQSLREAIERANAFEGVDTILFDPQVFNGEAEDVIRLVNGELQITEGVFISTNGLQVVVSGDALGNDVVDPVSFIVDIANSDMANTLGDNSRVFNIATTDGELVNLDGLTVTGGNAAAGGGGIVVSSTTVELKDVVIAGNQSFGDGGGILTDSELTLQNTVVSGNETTNGGDGGGIAAIGSDSITLSNSTVDSNNANGSGGGISADSNGVTLVGSSVDGNSSTEVGGGISASLGAVALTDSTVSGNFSFLSGGGIHTFTGAITLTESRISGNETIIQSGSTASNGGGIATRFGEISLFNSFVGFNISASDGGGIYSESGAIFAFQTTIEGNTTNGSEGKGGGIAIRLGAISLNEVTLAANQSGSDGGGIYSENGLVSFVNSSIISNSNRRSSADGGGIFAERVIGTSSTVAGNSSTGRGGGIFVQSDQGSNGVTLNSSTVSENSAGGFGGGIYSAAPVISISSSTVAFNQSSVIDGGGGLFNAGNDSLASASTFEISNSILARNSAAGVVSDLSFDSSDPLDLEFSLIGSNASTSLVAAPVGSPDTNANLIGTGSAPIDPLLGVVSRNGGLTPTHALLDGSPAIDSGSSTNSNDQRGLPFVREAGNAVDIGAYEVQSLELLVDTQRDEVDGNFNANQLSLREAIEIANANPGEDRITFDPDEFRGSPIDTIYLGLGELTITESVIIDGEDLGIVISGDASRDDINFLNGDITNIDENSEFRLDDNSSVLNITAAAGELVSLTGLTITGGIGEFGGISNGAADLVISRSNISGNQGNGSGAGIFNDSGNVTIDRSTISGNRTVRRSAAGGGIFSVDGDVSISFSTINDNQTLGVQADGGGIYTVNGDISLTLSTVSGNQTLGARSDGGGIASLRGGVLLDNVTVTQNVASGEGGGISLLNTVSNSAFTLNNTIVAGNDAADRSDLAINTNGPVNVQFSLIGDNTGTSLVAAPVGLPDANGNLIGTTGGVIDPLLGALLDNRGPTFTHELLPGSPAIDAGASLFATDQRDDPFFARNDGGGVDIGSLEQFVFNIVVDNSSDIDDGDLSAGNLSLREALSIANRNPATDTITFDPSVFNGEPTDVIRLLDTLSISDGVIIDAAELGIVISGDVAGDDVLVTGSNATDTFASETSDTLDDNVRVIDITALAGEVVSIIGLTITGGANSGDGGGIRNIDGDLDLTKTIVSGNRTGSFDEGGGIFSQAGQITLNESVVSDNFSDDNGGGIYSFDGTIILNDSFVNNNETGIFDDGGGIYSRNGDVLLNNSSVNSNSTGRSGDGGGIYATFGDITLINSSVNDNFTSGTSGEGGGIFARSGDVSLTGSSVNNNTTGNFAEGGGIYSSSGDVTLTDSSVANNSTGENADGGGIFTSNGNVTLTDSTVSLNSTGDGGDGGGIHTSSGDVTATRSTISLNQSGEDGGGVETFIGNLLFINSTISGNQSTGTGGGVNNASSDSVQLISSTVTNNQSGGDGGGIHNSNSSINTLTIENSIVAGNITTGGIGADLEVGSNVNNVVRFSLIGSNDGTPLLATGSNTPDAQGNLIGSADSLIDPRLFALADNGGPTLTHALLADSPAINAGGNPLGGISATDQRGSTRVNQGRVDMGAFESQIIGPQITDVILSSNRFGAGFVDAIDGQGIGNGNGLGFSLIGSQQLPSVPWKNIDTLYLRFSADVGASLASGDVLLTGTNGGNYSLGAISYDATTNVATIPIVGGIENDSLVISIFTGSVLDNSGLPVLGNDGGQFNFRFNVLPGDADGSGQVNAQDSFDVFAANTDLTIADNARLDIDGSGQITAADAFAAFSANTNGVPNSPIAPVPTALIVAATAEEEGDATVAEELELDQPAIHSVLAETAASIAEVAASDDAVLIKMPASDRVVFTELPVTVFDLPDAEVNVSIDAVFAETLASVETSSDDLVSEAAPRVLELDQSISASLLLVKPQISTFADTDRTEKTPSNESVRFIKSPELPLAGSIEVESIEVADPGYFSKKFETVDPVLLDSVFQKDLVDLKL